MFLCAVISLYPFRHSSFTVLLAILWLVAAALIAFAYCLSTLYDKSRVAGISVSMIYSLAMVPGYVMPLPPLSY
jgi:ATP-binding cassette subfamily A (ABC1) protein 3